MTLLRLRRNLFARARIIRHRAIIITRGTSIASFKEPRACARCLKVEFHILFPTLRAKIRPSFLCPFAALIHLDAFRSAKNRDRLAAKGISRLHGTIGTD